MGKDWIKKQKKDKYYIQAQKEGMRSRAAYKLRQIQTKFKILNGANLILDLCCAPGSWIEEVKRQFGDDISIVGVDLANIAPIKQVDFIKGDITDSTIITKLKESLPTEVDVILSDCSPKITGHRETDYARLLFLTEKILQLAFLFLRKGGHLVLKLFDGPSTKKIRDHLKLNFEYVALFKPEASRKKSPELYLIGKTYKKRREKFIL